MWIAVHTTPKATTSSEATVQPFRSVPSRSSVKPPNVTAAKTSSATAAIAR